MISLNCMASLFENDRVFRRGGRFRSGVAFARTAGGATLPAKIRKTAGVYYLRPVDPNPPAPRSVSLSSDTLSHSMRVNWRDDQLRDPLARFQFERLVRQVDQDHFDFAAVVGVDCPRALAIEMPCLAASPLRGRTWIS